jgi:hypothetical protein
LCHYRCALQVDAFTHEGEVVYGQVNLACNA